jgi:hypothetical protein
MVASGEERRFLRERDGRPPVLESARAGYPRAGNLDPGCRRGDHVAVAADLGVVRRFVPGIAPEAVYGVGVGLVAYLDPREPRAERGPRCCDLACSRLGVVVDEPDREQDVPAGRSREPREAAQVVRREHAAGPRGSRGLRVGPRHSGVGGGPAEAEQPRSEGAKERGEISAVRVAGYLRGARELEGEAEELRRDRRAQVAWVDPHRHGRGSAYGACGAG